MKTNYNAILEMPNKEVVEENFDSLYYELGRCVTMMSNKDIISATIHNGGVTFMIEMEKGKVIITKEHE